MAVRYIHYPGATMYPGSELYPQGPRSQGADLDQSTVTVRVPFQSSNPIPVALSRPA